MKAWEWLEQHEWVQGKAFKLVKCEIVGGCILGALNEVRKESMSQYDACANRIDQVLKKRGMAGAFMPTIDWNDAPGRTKEEVIALLKELDI